jgi:ornithine--oxo-acid transaminase
MQMGQLFREQLRGIGSPLIREIRGKGLLNAIVISHPDTEAAWKLCLILKENGLLAKPTHGDKIRLAPPLLIDQQQIEEAVCIIEKCLQEI